MPTEDNIPLSPSEKLTLRYIAEGELHPRELDWLALQRLKQAGLLQARPHGLKMTPEGMRALQRVLAGRLCGRSACPRENKLHMGRHAH